MLIRSGPPPEATTFYTPEDMPLQVGRIVQGAASTVMPHVHMPQRRELIGTPEVLLVEKGRMLLDLYADDRTFLGRRELSTGDIVVVSAGGHGIEFVEDTVLLEVKQGPYQGDLDKERF
jgi:hypothetical protein